VATFRMNTTGPLDHSQLLGGAVRLAMALGATYLDVRWRRLVNEREVLEALARDGFVIPTQEIRRDHA
jgi:hypothetical protein